MHFFFLDFEDELEVEEVEELPFRLLLRRLMMQTMTDTLRRRRAVATNTTTITHLAGMRAAAADWPLPVLSRPTLDDGTGLGGASPGVHTNKQRARMCSEYACNNYRTIT